MSVVKFNNDRRISDGQRRELRLFASKAGQSILGLATRLGLRVDEEDLGEGVSAVLLRSPGCGSPSGYRVAVNRNHTPERQRWSIAHEIAHFVLHRNDPDFEVLVDDGRYGEILPFLPRQGNSYRNGERSRLEREADDFVVALLMPMHLVKMNVNYRMRSVRNLASEFYVSVEAMRRRIAEIEAHYSRVTRPHLPENLEVDGQRSYWFATAPA